MLNTHIVSEIFLCVFLLQSGPTSAFDFVQSPTEWLARDCESRYKLDLKYLGVGRGGYKIAVFINRNGKPCILCSRNREPGYPQLCTNSHCPAGPEQAANAPGRVNAVYAMHPGTQRYCMGDGRIGACNGMAPHMHCVSSLPRRSCALSRGPV